jgi:uridine kinase
MFNNLQDVEFFSIPKMESPLSSHEMFLNSVVQGLYKVIKEDTKQKLPLFLKIKEGFIYSIANKIVKERKETLVLGVTGESASGKTTLVNNTLKACLINPKKDICTIISCDDYFKDTSKELQELGSFEKLFESGINFDVPDAYDLDIMKNHIEQLSLGKSIVSPRYSFITCESYKDGEQKFPAKVILSEGLFALEEIFGDILDASIYIDTPESVIEERWFKRAITRGKTPQDAKIQFAIVKTEARRHIISKKSDADVVINGLASAEYIEFIAGQIFDTIREAINEFVL